MAIVPNLNGVQISNQTPLVDPRNLSIKERSFTDDAYTSTTNVTLVNNNQTLLTANQVRNQILFMNAAENNSVVYISASAMNAVGQGIPLYPGNGYTFRGKAAQSAYYCWGVAGQQLTVMVG